MASITSRLTKVAFGGTATNLRSLFRGQKFLKLLKGITVGQAVHVPLSVGSKLELLLRAFVCAKFRIGLPCTLKHLSAYAYCHVCTSTCGYYIHDVHDRGVEGLVPSLLWLVMVSKNYIV